MTEQEAQQAQTIADIEQRHGWLVLTYDNETQPGDGLEAHEDRGRLLEIVDSQAQKIEQQDADISNLLNKLANWNDTYKRQELKIAEQAKEIELLRNVVNKYDISYEESVQKGRNIDFRIFAPARAELQKYDIQQQTAKRCQDDY